MKTTLSAYFDSAKRNCMLCHTYRNLRPSDSQKEMAVISTKKAVETLKAAFTALRAEDAELTKLERVKAGKVLCLDALDACATCDRQRPRIKEILIDIK
ncbi:Uncharacterised protein [uncultured archaeon]|nr:Uncharacterised protein [uncultured archaeon]